MPGGRYPWAVRAGGPLLGESAPPDPTIIWTWSPISNQPLPGGETFTRASVKQEFNGSIYNELASGVIPENSAAFGGGSQGFHPEPAATNIISQSEDLSHVAWSKTDVSHSNKGTSGIGLEAWNISADATNNRHRQNIAGAGTGITTGSVRFKAEPGQFNTIRIDNSGTNFIAFDAIGGSISETGPGVVGRITNLGNGWYLGENTRTTTVNKNFFLSLSDTGTPGDGSPIFLGTTQACDFAITNQESTAFATSPIVTAGAQGTRIADVLDTGIVIAPEFSALLDLTLPLVVGAGNTISLLGADASATDILRVDESFNVIMDDGGTPVTVGTASSGARIKVAYGRDATGRSASLDGATAVTGGAPSAAHEGNTFQLGSTNSVNQSRSIHHVSTLYDVRKSDAELENLSS